VKSFWLKRERNIHVEITKPEIAAVIASIAQTEGAVKELNDLELAMIGGGVGEVVLA